MNINAETQTDMTPTVVSSSRSRMADLLELTKPRIASMVLVATAAGYYMALPASAFDPYTLVHVLFGTLLVGGGASGMNMVFERTHDALMPRTKNRPLPAGRLQILEATLFSAGIAIAGTIYLVITTNWLAGFVALVTFISYVFIYTPLKRMTWLNTIVGAIPGALPPLIGWAAAANSIAPGAWTLFAILFFWQLPHFFAIAWMYREDYISGGFKMIGTNDPDGERLGLRVITQSFAMLIASLTPTLWGLTQPAYSFVAFALGLGFIAFGVPLFKDHSRATARRVVIASVIYLPLLMGALVIFKR